MRGGRRRISVFAPASVANFGVGFDVLGAALDGPGDTLTAWLTRAPGVRVVSISGDGGRLPRNPRLNTAAGSGAAGPAELGGRRGGDAGCLSRRACRFRADSARRRPRLPPALTPQASSSARGTA